ncbi:class I adenylate-forming enzyme family protein [Ramlibacter tataouinensis]|uniref:O-succinylbenzoate--CoA ligase-like protein n=1 Tax=Ramlibacter tataouinensis (strain ATCC BAA-407 / DSM 14655 / LMG 21543 / TTB310) TaxID=365046 RepID=F5XVJ4_RAMTT|nr:class I adenylate-forming enzyme family protein [Ramlibacter tataouinensis]AEG91570.1 O-succinylbenzoate--CoA ligase-like protein [Ramlibacter tataouinensis TTB310]
MLYALLSDLAARAPDEPALIAHEGPWPAARLCALADAWALQLHRAGHKRFGLCMVPSGRMVAALAAVSRLDASAVILSDSLPRQELQRLAARMECQAVLCDAAAQPGLSDAFGDRALALDPACAADARLLELPAAPDSGIRILSSGTTGQSKAIDLRWRDLVAAVRVSPPAGPRRWLLAYGLAHFAGIQVLLHALVHGEVLIVPACAQVPAMWAAASREGATHISSTPTFWRAAFVSPACASPIVTLRHVTLGGEVVTQEVLDRIAALYPGVSISQVYASTELGSVVSVKDCRAGLPLSLFDPQAQGGALLRIVNRELHVRQGSGPATHYRATGDLVERTAERVLFLGRKSETINVGGMKVYPQQIEALVNPLPGVATAIAEGRPNPMTGQIVRLRVVLHRGHLPEEVEPRIRAACSVLGRHARPRQIVYVDALETANMKLARRAAA